MSFNVLIVDDSSSIRAVVKKIIVLSGFQMDKCFEASDGRQAMELLADNWVDVIVSDINMPEINGLELLDLLAQSATLKEIPVIMVTTEGSDLRMKDAFARGAKGFIKKPFLPEEIKKVLYEVIGVGHDGQYEENPRNADELDF